MKNKLEQTSLLIIFVTSLLTTITTFANENETKTLPSKLVGKAELDYWFFDIYESRLYTYSGQYQQDQNNVLLELNYKRDVSEKRLLEHTRKEWQHLGVPKKKIDTWIEQLRPLWGSVEKGETLSVFINDRGFAEFRRNGELGGIIKSPELSQQFLAIWLSPQTSRPELRFSLLGKTTSF